ncbi:MAG TPA: DUF6456 domain-containing protein, partial [Rhizomicrobium sp.]|nr:DUF6456 domain-containing protein [Rhizomicrobium sp.]
MKDETQEKPERPAPEGPAKVTALHRQDRLLSPAAGAAKGFRRLDRLQWLKDHGAIGDHQLFAGRRLQADWQISKLEAAPSMQMTPTGGTPGSTLSDAKLDAGRRVKKALAALPPELVTLTCLFLLPEDHPFSVERLAAKLREDKRAVSYALRLALSMLARHYGYAM